MADQDEPPAAASLDASLEGEWTGRGNARTEAIGQWCAGIVTQGNSPQRRCQRTATGTTPDGDPVCAHHLQVWWEWATYQSRATATTRIREGRAAAGPLLPARHTCGPGEVNHDDPLGCHRCHHPKTALPGMPITDRG